LSGSCGRLTQLTAGQVVTAVANAGLTVEKLTEYPEQFWPMFKYIADAVAGLIWYAKSGG